MKGLLLLLPQVTYSKRSAVTGRHVQYYYYSSALNYNYKDEQTPESSDGAKWKKVMSLKLL